jgi:hypothetical protein
MSDKDDKVFYAATHVLASLVNDRETTRNYSRERAVDISIEYGELLVKKLEDKKNESE